MSLVSVGSVVAVFTDDSDFDYYLLLVKKNILTLNKDSTDSWGVTLVRRKDVFSGLIPCMWSKFELHLLSW
jgi:hypothetical protein